jgi:hypothetical protein
LHKFLKDKIPSFSDSGSTKRVSMKVRFWLKGTIDSPSLSRDCVCHEAFWCPEPASFVWPHRCDWEPRGPHTSLNERNIQEKEISKTTSNHHLPRDGIPFSPLGSVRFLLRISRSSSSLLPSK